MSKVYLRINKPLFNRESKDAVQSALIEKAFLQTTLSMEGKTIIRLLLLGVVAAGRFQKM